MLPRAIASTCSSVRVRYSDVGKRALPSRRATRTIPRASWLHAALVEVLIAQRIRAGLRQRDVAARIGKPQSAIASHTPLGQGRKKPSGDARLCWSFAPSTTRAEDELSEA